MMSMRPAVASDHLLSRDATAHSHFDTIFAPHNTSTMIIEGSNHNVSSMPVSPQQGETITADSLIKQDPQLETSSWDSMPSSLTSKSISPPPMSAAMSWPTSPMTAVPTSQGKDNLDTTSHSEHATSSEEIKDTSDEDLTAMSNRNCDRPDSSPSPHTSPSQEQNGSFEGPDMNGRMHHSEPFPASNIPFDASFERRSRRKPTIEDIVRRVQKPAGEESFHYDSDESEIEDDILNEQMMKRVKADNDEVDGTSQSSLRAPEGVREPEMYKDYSQFRIDELPSGVPLPPEDEEIIEDSPNSSPANKDFLMDVPMHLYDMMHEVKVNAHAYFTKTASIMTSADAKLSREQYLIQMLSKLHKTCTAEGLRPEVIREVLKDVETEVTLMHEDMEEMGFNKMAGEEDRANAELHFLAKPESEQDACCPKEKTSKDHMAPESTPFPFSPRHSSFLPDSTQPPFSSSTSLPSSNSRSASSPTTTSSSPKDVKPTIITVSAIPPGKDLAPPPPLIPTSGAPSRHHALGSNLSETAFSPGMFGNPFFPGAPMPNNLPPFMQPFGPNSPLNNAFARKFLPFEGKIGENVDKDYLKCQYCERTFRRQKNLENHIENTHQGKGAMKPRRDTQDMYFKCSHCPYTTKHQSNLYVHLRIHTGERPYICGACGVQYSQSHSLKSHIINKHDGIMSYYIKEKRTRSPRGVGYLTTQVMHDNSVFKMPPPLNMPPAFPNNGMDLVTKALELAKSDVQEHQRQMNQMSAEGKMPPMDMKMPPLDMKMPHEMKAHHDMKMPHDMKVPHSHSMSSPKGNTSSPMREQKMSASPISSSTPTSSAPTSRAASTPNGHPPPPFFMNAPPINPLMFGELPPHLRNPGHLPPHLPPHMFPNFPHFPPHGTPGFPGAPAGLSPLPHLSPNSAANMPPSSHPHQNLPMHLLHGSLPPMHPSPQGKAPPPSQAVKKEVSSPSRSPVNTPKSLKRPREESPERVHQSEGAIDLRKKTPPPMMENPYDLSMCCNGKENCPHEAKLKYLRTNVVKMLGILVPTLNFSAKGINAESEKVDDLLEDVIKSNVDDDDIE